ncbi:MAG: hypothetical protein WD960_08580 [Gemmatimonadota bacterium]
MMTGADPVHPRIGVRATMLCLLLLSGALPTVVPPLLQQRF